MYSIYSLYTALAINLWNFFISLLIRITLNWIKFRVHVWFIILDNQIIVSYVKPVNVGRRRLTSSNILWQSTLLNTSLYIFLYIWCVGCQSFISIRRVQISPSSEARVEHLLLHIYRSMCFDWPPPSYSLSPLTFR